MNVTRNNIDQLNAVITVSIAQDDIKDTVEKILTDYRKNANIPGFRKGMVPMNMIRKQYESSVKFEEINKLLQSSMQDYLSKEKITVLGQPLPVEKETIDWDAEIIDFDFEIGISPEFDADLSKVKVTKYNIEATEKEIDDTIERIVKQNGTTEEIEKSEKDSVILAAIKSETLEKETSFTVENLKSQKDFTGISKDAVITVDAQELFTDAHQLENAFGISHEETHSFNESLTITVKEISKIIPAEINEELFKKVFPNQEVKTEEEFRAKLKEETETFYQKESDTHFMNETTTWLIDNLNFDLPSAFLTKFIQSTSEKEMTDEEAAEEYKKSEKALRYQLIEGQILSDNKVSITAEDITNHAKENMKKQFAMYGYMDVSEEELDNFAKKTLQNEQQVRQISDELLKENLSNIFQKHVKAKAKKITFEDFLKEIKAANEKDAE